MKRLLLVAAVAAFFPGLSIAQELYPQRPISLIVPFAAGGPVDVIARISAEHMSRTLGQQLIVENVVGAGGTIGAGRAAQAAPDGYTLVMGHLGTHAAAPALYPKLKYDPMKDFIPVGLVAETPTVVVAKNDLPFKSFEEFVKIAREKEGRLVNANAGVGSLSQITCLLFNKAIGAKPTEVPYRGAGPAMNDVVGGQVDYICDAIVGVLPQVAAGTVKPIVISLPERSPSLPSVPSAVEQGIPSFKANGWYALFLPAATPPAIQNKLASALKLALEEEGTRKRLGELGAVAAASNRQGPAYMSEFQKSEIALWGDIIRNAGLKLE